MCHEPILEIQRLQRQCQYEFFQCFVQTTYAEIIQEGVLGVTKNDLRELQEVIYQFLKMMLHETTHNGDF